MLNPILRTVPQNEHLRRARRLKTIPTRKPRHSAPEMNKPLETRSHYAGALDQTSPPSPNRKCRAYSAIPIATE